MPQDAADIIFGNDPLFVWHPTDHRNALRPESGARAKGQIRLWNQLPDEIKELFIDVFVTNLSPDRCAHRATAERWQEVFRNLEANLITFPSCGKLTFRESNTCFVCDDRLSSASKAGGHKVSIKILSAGDAARTIEVADGERRLGDDISRHLASGNLFEILYSSKANKLGIKNLSRTIWNIVYDDGTEKTLEPGRTATLVNGMRISIIRRTAQLNIIKIS